MQIVVLDGYTLNPGDLSWRELEALGSCTVYDRTPADQVIARAANADIVLTNKTPLTADQIAALPNLKYIGVLATGFNIVDVQAARGRGIPVANVPTYGTRSVAQMTLALLLELTQHVGHHAETVRNGRWTSSPDFCYWDSPLVELDGLTLGILGFGRIGQAVGELARAFGMTTVCHTRNPDAVLPETVTRVPLERLFRESDVLSLHCPLTPETQHVVNRERLSWMKPTSFLLNTSRGPLIDEAALAEALNSGTISGAGLDVLAVEPPVGENPLLTARNCLVTPHIAWATKAARSRLMQTAVSNVAAFVRGTPQNVVNHA
ncbi:MAG: D-2-hydroxyacid dehydrogenase [Verrucomicrobia bacterium]|nr:D-2-hydroxyacid dehydrogenase [Verrucomicrobiota bacterium]